MDSTISGALDSHGLRLALVSELSESLGKSQTALLSFDLAKFESQTVRQAQLCCELVRLPEAKNIASAELLKAEADLRYRLRVYAALLRRARRTVEIFCRVLASSGVTYAPPRSSR
jgi:hypothetical protein